MFKRDETTATILNKDEIGSDSIQKCGKYKIHHKFAHNTKKCAKSVKKEKYWYFRNSEIFVWTNFLKSIFEIFLLIYYGYHEFQLKSISWLTDK